MQLDQDLAFGWDPPWWNERELHEELWGLTRIALRNWLKNPPKAEKAGRLFQSAPRVTAVAELGSFGHHMTPKGLLRWTGVVVAIPAGGFFGFVSGYYGCLGILYLQGKGNSHNDLFTVVASGMLGLVLGALLLPFCAWFLTRERRT